MGARQFKKTIQLTIFIFICLIPLSLRKNVYARDCQYSSNSQISSEVREITNNKFNFSFKIPSNYRTVSYGFYGKAIINLMNPLYYQYYQCTTSGKLSQGQVFPGLSIFIEPYGSESNLINFVQNQPRTYILRLKNSTISGQKALIYDSSGFDVLANTSFETPDKMYVVTVNSYYQDQKNFSNLYERQVFDMIIKTFRFNSYTSSSDKYNSLTIKTGAYQFFSKTIILLKERSNLCYIGISSYGMTISSLYRDKLNSNKYLIHKFNSSIVLGSENTLIFGNTKYAYVNNYDLSGLYNIPEIKECLRSMQPYGKEIRNQLR